MQPSRRNCTGVCGSRRFARSGTGEQRAEHAPPRARRDPPDAQSSDARDASRMRSPLASRILVERERRACARRRPASTAACRRRASSHQVVVIAQRCQRSGSRGSCSTLGKDLLGVSSTPATRTPPPSVVSSRMVSSPVHGSPTRQVAAAAARLAGARELRPVRHHIFADSSSRSGRFSSVQTTLLLLPRSKCHAHERDLEACARRASSRGRRRSSVGSVPVETVDEHRLAPLEP